MHAHLILRLKNLLTSSLQVVTLGTKALHLILPEQQNCLFPQLVAFALAITANGIRAGVDSKICLFFKNAHRSGLWSASEPVVRSTITKARQKVRGEAFEDIFYKAVTLADELGPASSSLRWHGMSVFACDGSEYTLPATAVLRKEFDPGSELEHSGKGHVSPMPRYDHT